MTSGGVLSGKVALVTGAGQGNGQAIALALATAGADVAINDLRVESVDPVTQEVLALGRHGVGVVADVTETAQIDAMVTRTVAELGRSEERRVGKECRSGGSPR